ncbi:MAG: diadenylate cyclase [Acidaminococcus sp.]|nr:diadenylate cyclase [Acidaminococcus sp.]MDD7398335.1 DNA integrity scanning protein DisA nucleotide-binding domain protein [Bacillota bacterium]MDY4559198.1 DNA integrity scanning protein DisA nucleotide-binding domain protein [Eubacteriales bacterium]MDY5345532.1 DNA integrity scanning protein DisA nucleotide-binding domain protein [Eubacteriales bacterium]
MFNFYEYFKQIDAFAIIDLVFLALAITGLTIFFIKKKQVKILLIYFALVAVALAVNILSYAFGGVILAVSRAIFKVTIYGFVLASLIVYRSDVKLLFQKITNKHLTSLNHEGFGGADELKTSTLEILTACQDMAKQDIGAIILITGANEFPKSILETGTSLNATLSAGLLESIFNTKAPLHDGAVVVKGNKILSAGCFLPLTQKLVNKEMGTRHRAAIGITEECDCLAIVVSEETGIISIVKNGDIKRYITMEKLKEEVERAYNIAPTSEIDKRNTRFK